MSCKSSNNIQRAYSTIYNNRVIWDEWKYTTIMDLSNKKAAPSCPVSTAKTPDLDRVVVASRHDFIFAQGNAADSSLMADECSRATSFLPRPHLWGIWLDCELPWIKKEDMP